MSGPIGTWRGEVLPSGQTGEAYRALKLPGEHGIEWKDGYPVVSFHTARGAGMHVGAVGLIPFVDIVRVGGSFPWEWTTNTQLYPFTASGDAKTLAYAKDQIRQVIREICGTRRP